MAQRACSVGAHVGKAVAGETPTLPSFRQKIALTTFPP
jgi:hypothetical protein